MNQKRIIVELARNRQVFEALFSETEHEFAIWKPAADQWSLLEVVCHLYDEEREDFRARVRHCLENPELPLPPIDPVGWVTERRYREQAFDTKLSDFLEERDGSVNWLRSLESPSWENVNKHPVLGEMSADSFLSNWLAHDHIHIRQINRIKYEYLQESNGSLNYAGDW